MVRFINKLITLSLRFQNIIEKLSFRVYSSQLTQLRFLFEYFYSFKLPQRGMLILLVISTLVIAIITVTTAVIVQISNSKAARIIYSVVSYLLSN